jgi:adenine phosphoribosyltransferase
MAQLDDNGNPDIDVKINNVAKLIKSHPDFPKKGILFRDFLPVFRNPSVVTDMIDVLAHHVKTRSPQAEIIVGLEARGFLLGPLLALTLKLPFVPIRKAGKLPGAVEKLSYELEYGSDTFELQKEAIKPGSKCVLIDDLLATGGSLKTSIRLIDKCNANVLEALVIIELKELKGRQQLSPTPLYSMITY